VGVEGSALSPSGTNYGVSGYTNSSDGYGVYGINSTSLNYGCLGANDSGVYGYSNANIAVFGYGNSGNGVSGISTSGNGGYFTSTSGYGLIVENGNVGIGVTDPCEVLDINGTARLRGISAAGPDEGATVVVDANGKLLYRIQISSKRYKTNIEDLELNTDAVLRIRPVSFRYKSSGRQDIGLIAEEVAEHLPDLVIYDEAGRPQAVKYDRVALYLLQAVKAQQERLAELEQRLEAFERTMQQGRFPAAKEVQQ
jgi:hypothetical protein